MEKQLGIQITLTCGDDIIAEKFCGNFESAEEELGSLERYWGKLEIQAEAQLEAQLEQEAEEKHDLELERQMLEKDKEKEIEIRDN